MFLMFVSKSYLSPWESDTDAARWSRSTAASSVPLQQVDTFRAEQCFQLFLFYANNKDSVELTFCPNVLWSVWGALRLDTIF